MAILTMNDVVAGLTAGQDITTYKTSPWGGKGNGYFFSHWKINGSPTPGSTPLSGGGEALTKATTGSIPYVNAGAGKQLYVGRVTASVVNAARFILYDRLVQTSGLTANSTSPQSVNSVALPRHTSGASVQLWLEFYSGIGATSTTCTITYTNQDGITGRISTPDWVIAVPAGHMTPCPLQAGDTGVRSVQSVQMSAAVTTGGDFGITLVKPIIDIPIAVAGTISVMDAIACGLPQLPNDTCLASMAQCTLTNQLAFNLNLRLIEG